MGQLGVYMTKVVGIKTPKKKSSPSTKVTPRSGKGAVRKTPASKSAKQSGSTGRAVKGRGSGSKRGASKASTAHKCFSQTTTYSIYENMQYPNKLSSFLGGNHVDRGYEPFQT
jgi:hypothetical protein